MDIELNKLLDNMLIEHVNINDNFPRAINNLKNEIPSIIIDEESIIAIFYMSKSESLVVLRKEFGKELKSMYRDLDYVEKLKSENINFNFLHGMSLIELDKVMHKVESEILEDMQRRNLSGRWSR